MGVSGATTLSTLGVTGATTLGTTLGVTGATTLGSTLGVTGATTLSGVYASGKVGISNSSPTYNLDVNGDINYTGNIRSNGTIVNFSQWTSDTNGINFNITDKNLGLGEVSNATYKLNVKGKIYASSGYFLPNNSSIYDDAQLHITTDDNMYFDIGVNTKIHINSSEINIYNNTILRGDKTLYLEGNGGLAFNSWGGGWFMNDNDYIRARNNKNIYTAGTILGGGEIIANGVLGARSGIYINTGTNRSTGGGFAYIKNGGRQNIETGGGNDGSTSNYGLWINDASRFFMGGGEINIASDVRIKKNIQYINRVNSLSNIRKINPATFNYTYSNDLKVGFVAQEVNTCLPEAISTMNNYISNIFCSGHILKINDDEHSPKKYKITVSKTLEDPDNIYVNGLIKICYDEKKIESFVEGRIVDVNLINNALTVEFNKKNEIDESKVSNNEIFVFGTMVDDFMTLDKDVIFTHTVSALQQVDRELQDLKGKYNELQAQLALLLSYHGREI